MLIDIKTIGHQIKQCRLQAGISQAAFAHLAEVSRATINALENGSIKEIGINRLNRVVAASRSLSGARAIPIQTERKSTRLDLSFPYDWSNSSMPDVLLIDKVVERGLFEDMAKVAIRYGTAPLRRSVVSFIVKNSVAATALNRMLANIEEALHVQT